MASRDTAGRNVRVPDLFLPTFNARFFTSRVRRVRTVFSAQSVDGRRALVTSDAVIGEVDRHDGVELAAARVEDHGGRRLGLEPADPLGTAADLPGDELMIEGLQEELRYQASRKGDVPEGHYNVPLVSAEIVRPGDDVTVITYGTMVHVCTAAVELAGVDAEIIDVRTLVPLDVETLTRSVEKTGRCVIAHEATRFCGYGAELSSTIQENCFWHLEAPVWRVTGWDTPYPHAFEWEYFPGQDRVIAGLNAVMEK